MTGCKYCVSPVASNQLVWLPAAWQAEAMIATVDDDGGGEIGFDEFVTLMCG